MGLGRRENQVTQEQVLEVLRDVQDPELHRSIVELDMVRDVRVRDGHVHVEVLLTIQGCPLRQVIVESIRERVARLPGVRSVDVSLGVMSPQERQALINKLRGDAGSSPFLTPDTSVRVLAVASGKGGVGKSTVTANLAVALAQEGSRVGVLDADVYGFSIPRLLGLDGRPTVIDQTIVPLERWGVRAISMGMLVDRDEAVIWRGPLLHKALITFITEVHWGELDLLLLDLPPGTGDVSITVAQQLPRAEVLVVTTPQQAAVEVAARAARMAHKVNLRVAGVVENMSYLDGPDPVAVFGEGGGQRLAERLGVPLLARIPLDPRICEAGDAGEPVVVRYPDSAGARAFQQAARRLLATPVS